MVCESCGGPVNALARTDQEVWLGCWRCHRTWHEDAGRMGYADPEKERQPSADAAEPVSLARGCSIALTAVALAFAVRLALKPLIGPTSPFLLFTPAVMIAAFYGGLIPGAVATVLSALLGTHFFLQTFGEPGVERWDRIALFALVGASITWLNVESRNARVRLGASLWRERAARAEAEAANRTKDEFLALVSHELQTPTSVVLGWASMLRTHPMDGPILERAVDAIERNARLQSKLVGDVLDASRIASGKLRLERRPVDVGTVVAAAVDQIRPAAERRHLSIDVDSDDKECRILGDSVRLQQVFTNLLSNAVKFTPEGGRIQVRTMVEARSVRVAVIDTGVGIDPGFLPRIFRRFEQDPHTLSHSRTGLGLGLSIARHFVERHGGTIAAESAGRGQGSTFTVILPHEPRVEGPREAPVAPNAPDTLDDLSVLIVEDDDDTRIMLTTTLERYGARVMVAESAEAGRALVSRLLPDMILCDLRLPAEDGIELMNSLRTSNNPRLAATPAVSMTASARPEDRDRAIAAGYRAHLQKPIDPDELVAVVRTLAGGTGRRTESEPAVH